LGDRPAFSYKEISSMKKLLATMLLSFGVATMASAQSSVTIYGLLDVGYIGKNTKGTPSTASNTTNSNQLGQSAETSSRLGFRGTEDLGGGTSAFFTVETGLTPNSSSMSGINNRQSFVGIAQKGLGNVAIGTQYGPIHKAVGTTDPGQQNNVIGSVIYPVAGTSGGQASADAAYTIRFNNAITATTDRFKGFSANTLLGMNNSNATQTGATTGGKNNETDFGIGADYTLGKFYAVLAYQNLQSNVTGATPAVSSSATGTAGSSGITYVPAFTATNARDIQTYAGATYDFAKFKVFAGYTDRKITSNLNSAAQLNRTAQQVGVRGYVTKKVEGWASAGTGKYSAFGTNQPTANFTAYQVGTNYWMSKRTNLYAIAGSTQTSQTSNTTSLSGNMYAAGVRHTF
jgi:predicted porin